MSTGPSLPGNPAPAYQYANTGGADQSAYGGTQSLPNYAAQNYPQVQGAVGNVTSGAYGAPQITGAGNATLGAAGQANSAASPLISAGTGQLTAGNSLVPYATQALQTGFDPQNQLYNQLYNQNQQQQNVTNAANGVAGSPYAAGVTNTADQNFNLDWQNAMLGRQQTGAGTAATLLGQGNQDIATGANAIGSGVSALGTGGSLAGQGANLLQSVPNESLSALSALNSAGGQATGVNQTQIQDLLSYLTGATSAANAGTSQYSAEANASLGQQAVNNQQLAGLGGLLGLTGVGGSGGLLGLFG